MTRRCLSALALMRRYSAVASNNIRSETHIDYPMPSIDNAVLGSATKSQLSSSSFIQTNRLRRPWSDWETERLLEAVKIYRNHGYGKWSLVSSYVGTRNLVQCYHKYTRYLNPRYDKGTWTRAEDDRLRMAILKRGYGNWVPVAGDLERRSPQQCRARAEVLRKQACYLHGLWSDAELERLKDVCSRHEALRQQLKSSDSDDRTESLKSAQNSVWTEISSQVVTRSALQCWSKYQRLLEARLFEPWSREDSDRLMRAVELRGRRWTVIALEFPNRTRGQLLRQYEVLRRHQDRLVSAIDNDINSDSASSSSTNSNDGHDESKSAVA